MPWKEPGKGDKDPWKSGDQSPPDLEDVFRGVNERVRSIFGGGSRRGGPGTGLLPLIGLLLLAWVVFDSVHIIDETERGVVLRFGDYSRTLQPGINLTLPRPFEAVTKERVSIRSVEDRGNMLTEDENLVELNYEVQYRVASPEDFLFKVRQPEVTLRVGAESALRESIGTNELDFILSGSGRAEVGEQTRDLLQQTLDLYESGIVVTQFNLKDVAVPAQVRDAFSDVNKAREDQERFIEEAQAHANSVVPEARGQAQRILQEAQGYRDATIALAQGEAQRFTQLLGEYQQAPEVTRKRMYLQTMENVLSRSSKVLLDLDSSGNVLYLPLDQLGGGSGAGARGLPPPLVTPPEANRGQAQQDRDAGRESRREGRQ